MISWSLLYIITEWIIRIVMLVYVPQKRTSAAARTWLLLIFLIPVPALLIYATFGRIRMPHRRIAMQQRASHFIRTVQEQMQSREPRARAVVPPALQPAATLAENLGDFHTTAGNAFELFPGYDAPLNRLLADIDAAQHHIHLLYYIFETDATGQRVADALLRAAQRRVKVRLLVDAIGSKRALHKLAPKLRAAGIDVHAMLPVGFFRGKSARFDLRNHRKIAIIDGTIAYTGSQNIVNPEFIKDCPNEELVVRATGPVVAQLQAVFLADYYFETAVTFEQPAFLPSPQSLASPRTPAGNSTAQVLPSGPGYQRENAQELIVALIHGARQRVVITTPYFVPDEPFMQALHTAAIRGVDVHLIFSQRTNQRTTRLAQESYYEDLLAAGVHIHLYRPRFLHAKHLTIDHDIALVGSTNIDIRSFALNAEVSLLIYDPLIVAQVAQIQQRYIDDAQLLDPALWSRRPFTARTLQNLARLADSFL
jgi:cardiolipin synthase A/B